MKKLMVMALCLTMMSSFAACSGTPSKEASGGQAKNEVVNEKAFSMGKIDGCVYESEFIGIGCELEDEWAFMSDEEIKELNNITADVAGEEYEELMEDAELIYDMYAIGGNQLDSINVNLEKYDKATLDSLVIEDALENTIPILEESFGNIGYTDIETYLDKINIEEEEFTCLYLTGEIEGVRIYQKVFPIKCNGYLANVTITTYGEDNVDSLAERFYFVE